ncbi:hypothetical protein [Nocardia sp. NPDC019395]|uniref:hypothetical protein n=1 Tax=Nocardia sp. NPDC019395 TaxID=3154686 RepID=UPI0033D50118
MTDKAAETGSGDTEDTAKQVAGGTAPDAAEATNGEISRDTAESAESGPETDSAVAEEAAQDEKPGSAEPGADSAERPRSDSGSPEAVLLEKSIDGPGTGADGSRSGSRRPRVLLTALAVAVVALIGAVGVAGYLFVQERDKAEMLAAHDEVRQAACRYAPVLANYDAKNLDPYFSAVLAGATGDWKKEFETTTTELREALAAGQVVSTAGDIQCAVKSADTTSAEVVVVIGQTISSLGTQGKPAPGQLAMVMRMQKTDGRWLVDQMTSPMATPMP